MHHSITSRFVIEKRIQGWDAYTEYGVAVGLAPVSTTALRSRFGKVCDGVLVKRHSDRPDQLFLVEVESALKSNEQLMRIISLARFVGTRISADRPLELGGVYIVYAEATHAGRIRRAARMLISSESANERVLMCSRITMVHASIRLPLTWLGFIEEPLTIETKT